MSERELPLEEEFNEEGWVCVGSSTHLAWAALAAEHGTTFHEWLDETDPPNVVRAREQEAERLSRLGSDRQVLELAAALRELNPELSGAASLAAARC